MGGHAGAAVAPLGGGAGGSQCVHLRVGLCLQLDGSALPLGDLCCLTGRQAENPRTDQRADPTLTSGHVLSSSPLQLRDLLLQLLDLLLQFQLLTGDAASDLVALRVGQPHVKLLTLPDWRRHDHRSPR